MYVHLGCLVLQVGDNQPYRDILFYTPFQHLLWIGPSSFTKFTESLFQIFEKEALHLTPGLLYLLYIIAIWIMTNSFFGDYYFYKNGMDKDFEQWYQKLGLLSIVYFILSIRYYNVYKTHVSSSELCRFWFLFKWIKRI
jgi:hypothetical protein